MMYFYQLMTAKEWATFQVEHNEKNKRRIFPDPLPKRIKHFYDNEYNDIVKQCVNNPDSCQNFYATLKKVGLPYQSYYHRIPEQVESVFRQALIREEVVIVHKSVSYSSSSSLQNIPSIAPKPRAPTTYYNQEKNDNWIEIEFVNYQPEPFCLYHFRSNQGIAYGTGNGERIYLHDNDCNKVHVLLSDANTFRFKPEERGTQPLRTKQLAQTWLNNLSALLELGNSPFTQTQDERLASVINYGFDPYRYSRTQLFIETCFRPEEKIAAFFYALVDALAHTQFLNPTSRMGDCPANESEGVISDGRLLSQARKYLNSLRHSEGEGDIYYGYKNDLLAKTGYNYLSQPIVLDGKGLLETTGDSDLETKLNQAIGHYHQQDNMTELDELFFTAVKLLKQLQQPPYIRHVETRKKYQIKVSKLVFPLTTVKECDSFYFQYLPHFKYILTSSDDKYRFVGRFDEQGMMNFKIPTKWQDAEKWDLEVIPIELTFVEKYWPEISGALQVTGGVILLCVATAIGATGVAVPLSAGLAFIAIDNIQAGGRTIATGEHTPTYGALFLEKLGVPHQYSELTYSLFDISMATRAGFVLKSSVASYESVVIRTTKVVIDGEKIAPTDIILKFRQLVRNQWHKLLPENSTAILSKIRPLRLKYQPTSGAILEAHPDKTTTILGTYKSDTEFILKELNLPKSVDFGHRNGRFNLLNTPDNLYINPKQFWSEYNKSWLDNAIKRDDIIILATRPIEENLYIITLDKGKEMTGFGREYFYLLDNGYVFDSKTLQMVKGR